MDPAELRAGLRLADNRAGRTVVLERRVNPMGLLVGPWWAIRNVATNRRTIIKELALLNGRRWTRV